MMKNWFALAFNRRFFLNSVILFVVMQAVFFLTENLNYSAGMWLFIRKSVVCAVAAYITQVMVKTEFFHPRWGASLLLLLWWLLFAIVKAFAVDVGRQIYENEIFIGVYGAAAFIVLQYLCEKFTARRAAFVAVDFLQMLLLLPPVVTLIHYQIYGYPIIYEEMLAVYNTTFQEATEWFLTYIGYAHGILIVVGILVLFTAMHSFRMGLINRYFDASHPYSVFILVASVAALSFYPIRTLARTDWVGHLVLAVKYFNSLKQYDDNIELLRNNINITSGDLVSNNPHSVVMVIGESTGRNYMRAYDKSIPYDNTPWLEQCKNDNDFIVFSNAYGCHSLTLQVLEHALTESSYYNDKDFIKSMNLIDLAKQKGYRTYWITNLEGEDSGSVFALVASRADTLINIDGNYDDVMLDGLKRINPNEKNFIVFHGRGSHGAYSARYPKERTVFQGDGVESHYANAVRYVDDFLRQIYEYGTRNLNMQVLLYFSDHGENLKTGHGPSDHSFDKVRIPMFIYLGKEYQQNNLHKMQNLISHKNSFYTNDMIYNTFSGIIGAQSNFYDEKEDISSQHYNYQLKDLYTFGHEVKVENDPFLRK